ncbi:hypothetical protein RvY_08016 [Ramazzottius varieornatus]|uniref:Uncharacterized protein n=1 Tax=Ramazzottius varieornatus TaxID=947166 RepID=A0A1D1VDK5_RAMVA|nr:hypothetical protein RvY_08016 [Ramazzottius varieornatus]
MPDEPPPPHYVVPGIQYGWLPSERTVMHYEGAAVHRVSVNVIPSSETEPWTGPPGAGCA